MAALVELPIEPSAALIARAMLAAVVAGGIVLSAGNWTIGQLSKLCRDTNDSPSPELRKLNAAKQATPSMGGVLIVAAILMAVLVCGDVLSSNVTIAMLLMCGMAILGAIDDLAKARTRGRGLARWQKFAAQVTIAVASVLAAQRADGVTLDVGRIAAAVFVIVATSNAVNLTDGLDGLAAGCAACASAALAVIAWFASEADSQCLVIVPVACAMLGATLGFLRFNRWPAHVFMGDTGSLALGGLLGFLVVTMHKAWIWPVVGGVFVVETLSVIVQVASFQTTGKRVLRCAPLHHHFQFAGWSEPMIVRRLCTVAAACALAGVGVSHLFESTAEHPVEIIAVKESIETQEATLR
jgi:phospho-N-acetylmuramoyl-pentapeptide-transferase